MTYIKNIWTEALAITHARLNNLETQYDEAIAQGDVLRADNTKELKIEVATSLPAPGNSGRLIYITNSFIYADDGSRWVPLGGKYEHLYGISSGSGTTSDIEKQLLLEMKHNNSKPNDYAGNPNSIILDGEFILVGGATVNAVRKYNQSDLSFVEQGPDYGGTLLAMAADATRLYLWGSNAEGSRFVRIYNKSTLAYIGATPEFANAANVTYRVAVDGTHIYAMAKATLIADGSAVRRYNLTSFAYVDQYGGTGDDFFALRLGPDHIYIATNVTSTIVKLNKSDLSLAATTDSYGGLINSIDIDANYIYAGGGTVNRVKRFNISTGAYVDQSPDLGGIVRHVLVGSHYIYAAVGTLVKQLRKSDLTFVRDSGAFTYALTGIAIGQD